MPAPLAPTMASDAPAGTQRSRWSKTCRPRDRRSSRSRSGWRGADRGRRDAHPRARRPLPRPPGAPAQPGLGGRRCRSRSNGHWRCRRQRPAARVLGRATTAAGAVSSLGLEKTGTTTTRASSPPASAGHQTMPVVIWSVSPTRDTNAMRDILSLRKTQGFRHGAAEPARRMPGGRVSP